MKIRRYWTLGLCLVLGGGAVQAAQAFDLTGNWTGKWTCQGFDGTRFVSNNLTSTMAITQVGDTLYVSIDGGGFRYNGAAVSDTVRPAQRGEVALVACGTDVLPMADGEAEMMRGKVALKPTGAMGVFKGSSIFEGPATLDPTPPYVGSCKYVYKRVDQVNPNITACP